MYFASDELFETSGRKILLSRFLDLFTYLTDEQLANGLAHCFEGGQAQTKDNYLKFVKDFESYSNEIKKISPEESRCPVILILDSEVQGLPW